MAAYCNAKDVKLAGNYWKDLGADAAARTEDAIKRAQAFVDQQTGSFFDRRTLQVTTEAISAMQKKLFMPGPVITLASVTEAGVDITANVLNYGKWLEKDAEAFGPVFPGDPNLASYWVKKQQGIVVVGDFGFNATPDDIVLVTAFIAASILGWVEKSYVDANGISAAFRDNVFPPWVQQILDDREVPPWDTQTFQIVAS